MCQMEKVRLLYDQIRAETDIAYRTRDLAKSIMIGNMSILILKPEPETNMFGLKTRIQGNIYLSTKCLPKYVNSTNPLYKRWIKIYHFYSTIDWSIAYIMYNVNCLCHKYMLVSFERCHDSIYFPWIFMEFR